MSCIMIQSSDPCASTHHVGVHTSPNSKGCKFPRTALHALICCSISSESVATRCCAGAKISYRGGGVYTLCGRYRTLQDEVQEGGRKQGP
jgi:hypothetical protein